MFGNVCVGGVAERGRVAPNVGSALLTMPGYLYGCLMRQTFTVVGDENNEALGGRKPLDATFWRVDDVQGSSPKPQFRFVVVARQFEG